MVTRYKMLARDVNSIPVQYRTWIVNNAPDLDAAQYTGSKSGPNPFVDISAYAILDDSVIADFNLPLPTKWQNIPDTPFDFYGRVVLPQEVSDAALAIIDGYVYLFGGKVTDKIFRASINSPGEWVDTGATLPTPLYNSSLAIVNGTIYLFGGNTGNESNNGLGAVDTIFSASVSDPLIWTNHGSLLPRRLHSSSLGMANGELYLFGGQEINSATDLIFTASTSNPLSWSIAGNLPQPLYGSTITQFNGFWYLLGGQDFPDHTLNTIFRAPVLTPTFWQSYGYMPYATSYGQFFPMGNDGYYVGPSPGDKGTGFTTVIQAPLNSITQWIDTLQVIPAVISHSHGAIIYDRLWLFGGSGSSAIFASDQLVKYDYYNPTVVAYGQNTRTNFQATDNLNEPFLALGIPYWKTDYKL
jgi:hypothetical protein